RPPGPGRATPAAGRRGRARPRVAPRRLVAGLPVRAGCRGAEPRHAGGDERGAGRAGASRGTPGPRGVAGDATPRYGRGPAAEPLRAGHARGGAARGVPRAPRRRGGRAGWRRAPGPPQPPPVEHAPGVRGVTASLQDGDGGTALGDAPATPAGALTP